MTPCFQSICIDLLILFGKVERQNVAALFLRECRFEKTSEAGMERDLDGEEVQVGMDWSGEELELDRKW